jgi:hypothetical protein
VWGRVEWSGVRGEQIIFTCFHISLTYYVEVKVGVEFD